VLDLERVARYTIPFHLLLPWILWGLAALDQEAPIWLFLALHLVFPVLLIASYRYWRGQGLDVVLLVVVNHAATFVSGALAAWLAAAT